MLLDQMCLTTFLLNRWFSHLKAVRILCCSGEHGLSVLMMHLNAILAGVKHCSLSMDSRIKRFLRGEHRGRVCNVSVRQPLTCRIGLISVTRDEAFADVHTNTRLGLWHGSELSVILWYQLSLDYWLLRRR